MFSMAGKLEIIAVACTPAEANAEPENAPLSDGKTPESRPGRKCTCKLLILFSNTQ
jgi:hypothetical protein